MFGRLCILKGECLGGCVCVDDFADGVLRVCLFVYVSYNRFYVVCLCFCVLIYA